MADQIHRTDIGPGDKLIIYSAHWSTPEVIAQARRAIEQFANGEAGYLMLPRPWSHEIVHADAWRDIETEVDPDYVSVLFEMASQGVLAFSHSPEPFSSVRWHSESGTTMDLNKKQMLRLASEIKALAAQMEDA